MNLWGITDIGIVRNDNQDSYHYELLDGETALAVVCDGMGGARGGSVASRAAVDACVEAVRNAWAGGERDWPELIKRAVRYANDRIHTMSLEYAEYRGMGTTLVAAVVTPEKIWAANVGDSRLYMLEEGEIRRVSRDHSFVEDLVERGEITAEEARFHPKKNLITRALGVSNNVKVDVFERENCGGYLLLCSDGLSNMVTDEEMRNEIVAEDKDSCCQRLLSLALERGAPDNVTVVIVQL